MAIEKTVWGETGGGEPVHRYELTAAGGRRVALTEWGAAVLEVEVPDRDGRVENVNLCLDDAAAHQRNPSYFGATIGRFANRIGAGRFTLGGETYHLAANNGPNHLHGGEVGFSHRLWKSTIMSLPIPGTGESREGVSFLLTSPDGEEGYPGTLSVSVTYAFSDDGELRIDYVADTDQPTVLNLTNHCYWNLAGAGSGSVFDHKLNIEAENYLPVDEHVLPTGEQAPVADTCWDFRHSHPIGENIQQAGGYDLCYVVDGWDRTLRRIAEVRDPDTGRTMTVLTTEPGVQLYTAEHLDGSDDNAGASAREAFCLECQHFPDSPNQPHFPITRLDPGEHYTQTTIYRFGVDAQ